jgi:hypothetical protein
MTIRDRYDFFRANAGGIVGQSAMGALRLARVEAVLETALDLGIASVDWDYDPEPYDPGTVTTADEARAKFESNEWTGPFTCIVSVGEDPYDSAASLGSIVVGQSGTRDPSCRVVAAELASEIEDDLRQAIGDARDRETCTFA